MPYKVELGQYVNPLLPDGETYVAGFLAKLTFPRGSWSNNRIVAVTTHGVHVFVGGAFAGWRAKKLLFSLPPGEPITYSKLLLVYRVHVGDERLNVGLFSHNVLVEAVEASQQLVATA